MLRFGAFTFDPRRRRLAREGEEIHLSPKAFRLLELLVEERPAPVRREQLYAELWPDVVVEQGNLHGLVAEIRAALGDRGHEILRTVHRVGYAFTAPGAEDAPAFSILVDGYEIPLRAGENVIGRDPRDAIVIQGTAVSRHHARLVVTGDTVTLEDLGSKNGTFLGRKRVEAPVEVRAGDDILVGTVRLRLVSADPLAPTATAG